MERFSSKESFKRTFAHDRKDHQVAIVVEFSVISKDAALASFHSSVLSLQL
jgi:hypothetical protein